MSLRGLHPVPYARLAAHPSDDATTTPSHADCLVVLTAARVHVQPGYASPVLPRPAP